MDLEQSLVLFHRAPGKRSKVGRKPVGSAHGNWTTQLQPANKTRKPMACTFHGKCIPCIFLSWQCLSCFHSGNYKCRTNAIHLGAVSQQPSSHRGQCDVKIRNGHETWYPSVLLVADEEGLWLVDKWLFKICRKDTRRTTTKKRRKNWKKATTSRRGGFLNFLNTELTAQAFQREWC